MGLSHRRIFLGLTAQGVATLPANNHILGAVQDSEHVSKEQPGSGDADSTPSSPTIGAYNGDNTYTTTHQTSSLDSHTPFFATCMAAAVQLRSLLLMLLACIGSATRNPVAVGFTNLCRNVTDAAAAVSTLRSAMLDIIWSIIDYTVAQLVSGMYKV